MQEGHCGSAATCNVELAGKFTNEAGCPAAGHLHMSPRLPSCIDQAQQQLEAYLEVSSRSAIVIENSTPRPCSVHARAVAVLLPHLPQLCPRPRSSSLRQPSRAFIPAHTVSHPLSSPAPAHIGDTPHNLPCSNEQ